MRKLSDRLVKNVSILNLLKPTTFAVKCVYIPLIRKYSKKYVGGRERVHMIK